MSSNGHRAVASVTEWVQLRVAGERYAIDVAQTLEVGSRGALTSMPGAPPAVLGVHNLRGQVLPVLDLAAGLGLPADARTAAAYHVVVEAGGHRAALVVDEILAVGVLDGAAEPVDEGSVRGHLVADGQLFGVLDVGRLLASLAGVAG